MDNDKNYWWEPFYAMYWHAKWYIQKGYHVLRTRKCLAKGCERRMKPPTMYCGFECAAYDGVFGIRTGWNMDELKKKHPKEYAQCHNLVGKKLSED